jgi:hypothetical protein
LGDSQEKPRFRQHATGLFDKGIPFGRHDHAPRRALEDDDPKPGFELSDLRGQRWLSNPAMLGRADKAAMVGNGDNVFEIAQRQPTQIHRAEASNS